MKIKLSIRRPVGTVVKLDQISYEFNDDNDHTVDVQDATHIARFMNAVGYEQVSEPTKPSNLGKEVKPVKPKRKRRTKAEMAAARAAEAEKTNANDAGITQASSD